MHNRYRSLAFTPICKLPRDFIDTPIGGP